MAKRRTYWHHGSQQIRSSELPVHANGSRRIAFDYSVSSAEQGTTGGNWSPERSTETVKSAGHVLSVLNRFATTV